MRFIFMLNNSRVNHSEQWTSGVESDEMSMSLSTFYPFTQAFL